MQTILAGRIDTQQRAEELIAQLSERGVARGDMQSFYLPPPGQRARFAIGGDQYADRDAREAPKGQAKGAAIGTAAGLVAGGIAAAAVPPLAPVILAGVTGVGALAGTVAGAVSSAKSPEESEQSEKSERPEQSEQSADPAPQARRGGLMVAVRVTPRTESIVMDALQAAGVQDIERASGEWRDGQWIDFDPSHQPDRIDES